jgi:hypothetical protein
VKSANPSPRHGGTGALLTTVGELSRLDGRLEEADALAREALSIAEEGLAAATTEETAAAAAADVVSKAAAATAAAAGEELAAADSRRRARPWTPADISDTNRLQAATTSGAPPQPEAVEAAVHTASKAGKRTQPVVRIHTMNPKP